MYLIIRGSKKFEVQKGKVNIRILSAPATLRITFSLQCAKIKIASSMPEAGFAGLPRLVGNPVETRISRVSRRIINSKQPQIARRTSWCSCPINATNRRIQYHTITRHCVDLPIFSSQSFQEKYHAPFKGECWNFCLRVNRDFIRRLSRQAMKICYLLLAAFFCLPYYYLFIVRTLKLRMNQ